MNTTIWSSPEWSEWLLLGAAVVCAVIVVLDLVTASRRTSDPPGTYNAARYTIGVNWLAVAVGLIALGLLAL